MLNEMYYDVFTDEYVIKKDLHVPPERYIPTYRGVSGICEESWAGEVDGNSGYALTIAYSYDEYYTEVRHEKLTYMCKKNRFKPTRMRYFVLPPEKFDEYARMFGLEEQLNNI